MISTAIRRAFVVLLLLWSGVAVAQDLDPEQPPERLREAAADAVARMESALEEVQALQAEISAEEGDLQRSECVADAAAAIQGFVSLASDAAGNLDAAISAADQEGIAHQASIISIASGRVQNLVGAANQCTGEMLTFAGEGGAEVTIDDDIPDEDDETDTGAADDQLTELVPDEPLPEATPYQ